MDEIQIKLDEIAAQLDVLRVEVDRLAKRQPPGWGWLVERRNGSGKHETT